MSSTTTTNTMEAPGVKYNTYDFSRGNLDPYSDQTDRYDLENDPRFEGDWALTHHSDAYGQISRIASHDGDGLDNYIDTGVISTGFLSTGTPLADGNISDDISIGSEGAVDTGALSGVLTNDVDAGFVGADVFTTGTPLSDGNISDELTIGSGGSVSTGALSGVLTNDVEAFVSVTTPLSSGNISTDAITGDELAADAVGSIHIQSGAVGTDQIANDAVNETHLQDMGCEADQVLELDSDGVWQCVDSADLGGNGGDGEPQNLAEVLAEGDWTDGQDIVMNGSAVLDMDDNTIQNLNALQSGEGTDTLRLDGDNVEIPQGNLDIGGNITSSDRVCVGANC